MRPSRRAAAFLALLCVAGCGGEGDRGSTTDLHVVDMWSSAGLIHLADPRPLTTRPGYDNQPAFTADGSGVLYVSRRGGQTDVYRYDLASGQARRLTDSREREYSPQPLPSGTGFSAVRAGTGWDQTIWVFDEDGGGARPLIEGLGSPVSYYAWVDEDLLVAVLERAPGRFQLAVVHVAEARAEPILENVGRCLQRVPGRRAVSFVHRVSPADWWIKEVDVDTGEVTTLTRAVQGAEDHAWMPDGVLISAGGSRLYVHTMGIGGAWEEVADLGPKLGRIGRIAVQPQGSGLVLVDES